MTILLCGNLHSNLFLLKHMGGEREGLGSMQSLREQKWQTTRKRRGVQKSRKHFFPSLPAPSPIWFVTFCTLSHCMPPKLSTVWMILLCIIFCILSGLPVCSAEAIPKLLYNWINPVMSDWNSSGHTHV